MPDPSPTPGTPPARPVLPYFLATLALTWGLQLPALLAQRGVIAGPAERLLPLAGLGVFGPLLAALVVTRLDGSGARPLFRQLRGAVPPGWALLALLTPGLALTLGLLVHRGLGGAGGPWLFPPDGPPRWVALALVPLVEELGWRGLALPRLVARFGRLPAALVLGAVWAVWHVPMLLLAGVTPGQVALMLPYFVAGSVVFSWLYHRAGDRLLIVVLAHAGSHLDNAHRTLPGDPAPFLAQLAVFVALAATVVVVDRGLWRGPAGSAPRPPVPE